MTLTRTTIKLEVLSEDSLPVRMDITDVIRECDEGEFVLASRSDESETLSKEEMSKALIAGGSDPQFFQLSEEETIVRVEYALSIGVAEDSPAPTEQDISEAILRRATDAGMSVLSIEVDRA